jgi:hypothetical protein
LDRPHPVGVASLDGYADPPVSTHLRHPAGIDDYRADSRSVSLDTLALYRRHPGTDDYLAVWMDSQSRQTAYL